MGKAPAYKKVQPSLRVSLEQRDALVAKAHGQGCSLNDWAVGLILNGKEQPLLLSAGQVLDDAVRAFQPLLENAHVLSANGDYRRAVSRLALLLQPLISADGPVKGREREALIDALAAIDIYERKLEIEASDRFRSMRTPVNVQ